MLLPLIDPNIMRGKINVTHNCGPGAPSNFGMHEINEGNKKSKEADAKKKEAKKSGMKNVVAQEKEGSELIAANRTHKASVATGDKKSSGRKKKSKLSESASFEK
jgi:hypothetical protein